DPGCSTPAVAAAHLALDTRIGRRARQRAIDRLGRIAARRGTEREDTAQWPSLRNLAATRASAWSVTSQVASDVVQPAVQRSNAQSVYALAATFVATWIGASTVHAPFCGAAASHVPMPSTAICPLPSICSCNDASFG